MKTTPFILLAVGCLNVSGQTNAPCISGERFTLPQPQLRKVAIDEALQSQVSPADPKESEGHSAGKPANEQESPAESDASFSIEQATSSNRESDLALYRRLEAQGCFNRPQEQPENYFVHAVTTMFDSEVIHVGKITVTGSLITAIKKKNPLCLLNPLVLNVSW